MNIAEVRQHIHHWVESTLSVPSPLFNNLPPCPYARDALLNNKVDVRCANGAEILETVTQIGKTWNDAFELILVASEPESISPEDLIAGMGRINASFEAMDLISFFDHPLCTDPKHKVTSCNGKYVFVGTQRLTNFLKAAKPLYKRNYFAQQSNKQFSVAKNASRLT